MTEVSIHAPARGATPRRKPLPRGRACFNPRPRERGDQTVSAPNIRMRLFQSTPPREGRHEQKDKHPSSKKFQSTPPREGRLGCEVDGFPAIEFQSTPPREGRPSRNPGDRGAEPVSIHAPARGATDWRRRSTSCLIRFNPRPRERGDHFPTHLHPITAGVSIHAPARGATT